MDTLLAWPPTPPPILDKLYGSVAEDLHAELEVLEELGPSLQRSSREAAGFLVVLDGATAAEHTNIGHLAALLGSGAPDTVIVTGDGHLGTDAPDLGTGLSSAAAVAVARSVAVRRGPAPRVNVVCLPDALFGRPSTQRGPLKHEPDGSDAAGAVAFLLGPAGAYINGQVLFVNGGRQLFSSLTS